MADKPAVTATPDRGVVLLQVSYGPELMLAQGTSTVLSEELVKTYKQAADQNTALVTTSCVVVIKAETAGSPLVRALFELYRTVYASGGQVICVDFPSDYIDSLTTLGLTALPGFSLAGSEDEAISRLLKQAQGK
jgi:hypothetical protein